MRFVLEFLDRFVTFESGRLIYDDPEPEPDDEPELIRVPMGFTAIQSDEDCDSDESEEFEVPEEDCR